MKSLSKFSSWAALSVLIGNCACGCASHPAATSQAPFFTSVAETAAAQFPIYATAIPLQPSATQTLMPTSTYAFFPTLTPYATYAVEATSSACNDSAYVADVTFPDNTVLARMQTSTRPGPSRTPGIARGMRTTASPLLAGTR